MRNVLSGIVDVCRVLALLILAAGGLGVAYLMLVTRMPSEAQASTAATDKIGPTYAYAAAPVIAPPARGAVVAAARTTAKAAPTVAQVETAEIPVATKAVANDSHVTTAEAGRAERVRTASLETGSLSDATQMDDEPRRASRKSMKRTAGAAGCEHFRSFDPISQTYRAYNGRIRECRVR